jgi:large subunit ribosomal protein L21
MYAIVEIAGKQFRVSEKDVLFVPRLDAEEKKSLTLDRVLLVSNDDDVRVGAPTVSGATVTATVLGHVKGDKMLVFKKRKRKRFKVMRGHRQQFTRLQIDAVSLDGAKKAKKSSTKKTTEVEAEAEA